jgi:hypothetical protein
VQSRDEPGTVPDDQRPVDFEAEDVPPLLPDQTIDDTDRGWGDRESSNDDRLLEDKPPHWA